MRKIFIVILSIILISSAAFATTTKSATTAEEHAIAISSGTDSYDDIIVTKTGDGVDSNGSEYYDWYGRNAAILASDGTLTISSADITSDATYGSAVFAYGGTINISDSKITTSKKNSGGIMVTNGGTITANDLTITTAAGSSAAIRSDKGGGTITATGGTYTANGSGSPAVYSTAAITVSDATLNSGISQGVVIEGGNSVTLKNTAVNANHTNKNGQDSTYQAVLIYQSGSGDASEGSSAFTMTGGSITNAQGDIFCVTNTTCTISLTGVTITNNDSTGNFLRAEGQNWGSNGGTVTLNASGQTISGNIIVASDSSLTMTLKDSSSFTGAINPDSASSGSANVSAAAGNVNVTVEEGSTLTLTGNSYITSLTAANSSNINYGDYSLTVGSTTYNASNPYGGSSDTTDQKTDDTTNNENQDTTNNILGSSGSGCNVASYLEMAMLICLGLFLKRK